MLLLAGFFDFAWLFYWQHSVTNASRAGARYGVQANYPGGIRTPYTDAEIQTLVQINYGADLEVRVDRSAGNNPGAPRSVTVTKTMQWFCLGILQSFGVPLPAKIDNKTTMTME